MSANGGLSEVVSGGISERKRTGVPVGVVLSWCWKLVKRRLSPGCPLFHDGDLYCQLAAKYLPLDTQNIVVPRQVELPCGVGGCSQVFTCLQTYESHYNSCHRNTCSQCRRVFPSAHLLDVHILESHDVMFKLLAQKQDMYQCLVESCPEKFSDSETRRHHMIKTHRYPANYRFDRRKKAQKAKNQVNLSSDMVIMETDIPLDARRETKNGSSEAMDVTGSAGSSRMFSYKVPKDICFGAGSSRGFISGRGRGRGGRRGSRPKHWHQQHRGPDTAVDIESVDMAELVDALT